MPARDVFLSYASKDRTTHARPLADALARHSVSCWVDEAEIEPGDSIIDAINDGLALSRYVIVVITENFLDRVWTTAELRAAFHRQMRDRTRVVIPVLAADPDEWATRYPLFADLAYVQWNEGPERVAEKIARLFTRRAAPDWTYAHPRDWVGLVWTRITREPGTDNNVEHRVKLRWGPYVKNVDLGALSDEPVSLVHHKTDADDVLLHVDVNPPAVVTFGQGPAPDAYPRAVSIDEGWTRAAGMPVTKSTLPRDVPLPRDRRTLRLILGGNTEEALISEAMDAVGEFEAEDGLLTDEEMEAARQWWDDGAADDATA